ncbi:TIGR02301 family protein [Zhengella mangrovi]|uniref:TIGR02301 family protein n=1 Tax=Zhengella mangrovi TaxID=1982044 RepID=A0A2G1QSU6_9HYPH|nr:TIGR02301 family protein [Zhengella mangrovi]PHP68278.1 TIGR02301 family protein [Zhengella mangrovi]
MNRARPALLVLLFLAAAQPAGAQTAPYDDRMIRLAEVLGSLHYLRNLCGEKGNAWRNRMEDILAVETPDGDRRKRYIASFNRGYRSYAAIHTTCTDASMQAIDRYMKEGESLSREIVVRFGG